MENDAELNSWIFAMCRLGSCSNHPGFVVSDPLPSLSHLSDRYTYINLFIWALHT